MKVSMQKRPCDMQNFDLWLFICSKVQHTGYIFLITFSLFGRNHTKIMHVQKHIFRGSFFCSADVQHDTEFLSPNNEFFFNQ